MPESLRTLMRTGSSRARQEHAGGPEQARGGVHGYEAHDEVVSESLQLLEWPDVCRQV